MSLGVVHLCQRPHIRNPITLVFSKTCSRSCGKSLVALLYVNIYLCMKTRDCRLSSPKVRTKGHKEVYENFCPIVS